MGEIVRTTLLKRRCEMETRPIRKCHDGTGEIDFTNVLACGTDETEGTHIMFFHDDVLPPETSIGGHKHTDAEEHYFIVSGHGVMTLDDEEHEIGPGDIAVVYPGGSHGLANTGSGDLRVLVICPR